MLTRVWAAVGAAVCGVAIVALSGRGTQSQPTIALLGILGFGVAATAVLALGRRQHWRRRERRRTAHDDLESWPYDRELVCRLEELIEPPALQWLRSESFAAPWPDFRLAPFRELLTTRTSYGRTFDPEIEGVVRSLTDALTTFFEFYDTHTIADPIIPDAAWRMVGNDNSPGKPTVDPTVEQRQLRALGVELCECYENLSLLSTKLGLNDGMAV